MGEVNSLQRLQMKPLPSAMRCLLMAVTGSYAAFHHEKLYELYGGQEVLKRIGAECANVMVLTVLMLSLTSAQFIAMVVSKESIFSTEEEYTISVSFVWLAGAAKAL